MDDLQISDCIEIKSWTDPHPNTKMTIAKIRRIDLPLIFVDYVRIWINDKITVGCGNFNINDINTFEIISQDKFDTIRNISKS